ncbi:hypothetical protein D9M72_105110 [compost metagenome]
MPPTSSTRDAPHNTSATDTVAQAVYVGIHHDGRLRIILGRDKALAKGVLYEINEKHCADGTTKKTRRRIHATPGYQVGIRGEVSLLLADEKTGKPHRLKGLVKHCRPRSTPAPRSNEIAATASAPVTAADDSITSGEEQYRPSTRTTPESPTISEESTTAIAAPCDSADNAPLPETAIPDRAEGQTQALREHQRAERRDRALQREDAAVKAQRLLGLDPLISITYLSHISGRSISTLYRAFGKELPKPIKVGSRSRVPYSAAVAYMAAR